MVVFESAVEDEMMAALDDVYGVNLKIAKFPNNLKCG